MIYHFTIIPDEGDTSIVDSIELGTTDPRVVHLDMGAAGHALVFCNSSELALYERQRFEEKGSVSPSLCATIIDAYGIHINQECSDDSREGMMHFVRSVLEKYPESKVFNDDTGEDLSLLSRSDLAVFFDNIPPAR